MRILRQVQALAKIPIYFMWRVIVGFRANKGLVLSSALAFNILLSIVPCFTLLLVALSQLVDDQVLLLHIENNLELVVPGLSETILLQAEQFLRHRGVAGSISIGFYCSSVQSPLACWKTRWESSSPIMESNNVATF